MKTIQLQSRYGKVHKLIPTERENVYRFQPAEEWMTISLLGEEGKYKALDTDGGPMIYIGFEINDKKVKSITDNGENILVELC